MNFKNKLAVSLVITFLGGLVLSLSLFFWIRHHELQSAQIHFSELIEKFATVIKHSLDESTHTLNALKAYHHASNKISRDEFKRFTQTILALHPEIQALAWIPEASLFDKESYEQHAHDDNFTEFHVTQYLKGNMFPAMQRRFYYPVYYIEPVKGNEKIFGFDLGSEMNRKEALLRAKNSKNIAITAPVSLIQDIGKETGFLVFQPIHINKNDQYLFQGFYLEVIRVGSLISKALKNIAPRCEGVNMHIFDVTASAYDQLYSHYCNCKAQEMPEVDYSTIIEYGGRIWKLEAVATTTFTDHYMTLYSYIILVISLLVTLLLNGIYYLMQRRYIVLEQTNEDLRRFQNVAIGREKRIAELKAQVKILDKGDLSESKKS